MTFPVDPAASSFSLTDALDGRLAAQLGCADAPEESPAAERTSS